MFCFGFRFARFSFPPSAISASPREASLLLLCMLTRYSAALRLPTLGYTVDSFAPAQLIRRISPTCSSFGAALRQSISTFPEGLDSPFGLPAAGYPASARWHVFSAALRLPPSLPLMSPYGLPSAGYPASARWHVFRFQPRIRLDLV